MSKRKVDYPIGSISSGTMRPEDLIPTFAAELTRLAKQPGILSPKRRKEQLEWLQVVTEDIADNQQVDSDLDILFDMLSEYAGPYFYFGAHPGDGSDYGYWLSESFADDFDGLKVSDLSEVPSNYLGEVLLVNDHGNISLYVKSARKFREIWSVV